MPELPDIEVYAACLRQRVIGERICAVCIRGPFLLRTVDPPVDEAVGQAVRAVRRPGKRLVLALNNELFLVLHLMIAGRLLWKPPGGRPPVRITLATFDFSDGALVVAEAATKKRASLHLAVAKPRWRRTAAAASSRSKWTRARSPA